MRVRDGFHPNCEKNSFWQMGQIATTLRASPVLAGGHGLSNHGRKKVSCDCHTHTLMA